MKEERRDKTYALRLSEEEFKMFRDLSKKINLANVIREYVSAVYEQEKRDTPT